MLEMILFHHHRSIYNKDWSKVGFSLLCSNPCYIYYSHFYIYIYIYRSNLCRSVCENYKTYRDDQPLIRKEMGHGIGYVKS